MAYLNKRLQGTLVPRPLSYSVGDRIRGGFIMVMQQGEKIHVIIRRRFEDDLRRHFIGEVLEVDGLLARIEGYVFIFDTIINQYIRRTDKRTRIVGLADSGNIINILPTNADLQNTKYVENKEERLVVTDGKTFEMDINEFGVTH